MTQEELLRAINEESEMNGLGRIFTMDSVKRISRKMTGQRAASGGISGGGNLPRETAPAFLYDTEELTAGDNVVNLFQNIAGKTEWRTNMKTAGVLTFPNTFHVQAVAFQVCTTDGIPVSVADAYTVLKMGVVRFEIESKEMWKLADLTHFPAGGGIRAVADGAAAPIEASNNGYESIESVIKFGNVIKLNPQMSFAFDVSYPEPGGLGDLTGTTLALRCTLYGRVERAIQ